MVSVDVIKKNNGIILDKAQVTVKTTYTNYNKCDSDGVSLEVKPTNNVPTETTTQPANDNDDFTVNKNADNITIDEYNTMKSLGTLITVIDKNGSDITDIVAISYPISPTDTANIIVKHNGKEKKVTIKIVS